MSTENTTNKESAWRIWKGEREFSYLHVSVMVLTFYINGLLFSYDAESVESLTGDEIKETTVSIAWRKEILYKNYLYILENVKQSCKENVINRKHRHRHTHLLRYVVWCSRLNCLVKCCFETLFALKQSISTEKWAVNQSPLSLMELSVLDSCQRC